MAVEDLSHDDVLELQAVKVEVSGHEFNALSLLYGWAGDLARIRTEIGLTKATKKSWNAYDLIGSLHARNFLEDALNLMNKALRQRISTIVRELDEIFVEITESDPEGSLVSISGEVGMEGWWWYRVPLSGPIRKDIEYLRS